MYNTKGKGDKANEIGDGYIILYTGKKEWKK